MKGLMRLIVLGAAAALFAWFFLSLGPDRAATHQPRSSGTGDTPAEPSAREPWTQEDRAVWRDRVDQRLHR